MFNAIIFVIVLSFVLVAIGMAFQGASAGKLTAAQRVDARYAAHGSRNPEMVCPHCQVTGKIYTRAVKTKKGVSGGKATGAILTGGVSLLATGLARKEDETKAFCSNCSSQWHF